MSTYGEAQKKYYEKNKQKILDRTKDYKREYNKEYFQRNKQKLYKALKVQQKQRLINSLFSSVQEIYLDNPETRQKP